MNIAKKDVPLALKVAEEKMKEFSVQVNSANLDDYKLTLSNISKNHSYAEGEPLSFDDSQTLVGAIRKMMRGIESNFYNLPDEKKREANVAGMIMAANDYMVALAMEELNSPILSEAYCTDQLETMYSALAGRLLDRKPRKEYLTSVIFDEQRGIDAQELKSGKVDNLIKAVHADPDNIEKIADLYAEYQALAKRQENHGAIWRLFHRKENAARTALLNEMRAVMEGKIPKADLDEPYTDPATFIHAEDAEETQKAISEGVTNRVKNTEKGFEYFKYKSDQGQQPQTNEEIVTETTVIENVNNELGTEKTKVYIPDLSEKIEPTDKTDKIEEKTISAPSVEIKQ